MRRVFADSFYFFAILNPKDDSHQRALRFATEYAGPIVTTAWVLTDLYDARADKHWSLTDCISFLVMQDRQIAEALTGDHHFEQAGYVALLK